MELRKTVRVKLGGLTRTKEAVLVQEYEAWLRRLRGGAKAEGPLYSATVQQADRLRKSLGRRFDRTGELSDGASPRWLPAGEGSAHRPLGAVAEGPVSAVWGGFGSRWRWRRATRSFSPNPTGLSARHDTSLGAATGPPTSSSRGRCRPRPLDLPQSSGREHGREEPRDGRADRAGRIGEAHVSRQEGSRGETTPRVEAPTSSGEASAPGHQGSEEPRVAEGGAILSPAIDRLVAVARENRATIPIGELSGGHRNTRKRRRFTRS